MWTTGGDVGSSSWLILFSSFLSQIILSFEKILSFDNNRPINYRRNQEIIESKTNSILCNISQALAFGYPEPLSSGNNNKRRTGKIDYHRTSKKAFNVFCATKQRKKRIIQRENRRKHLLRRIDDILYSTKEKRKEQIRWTRKKIKQKSKDHNPN